MKTTIFELFFFRRFFFSLKRKSGKITVILLSLLLLAACQPTPEVDAVTNKAEGRLEQLIVAAPEESAAPERTVRARVGAPEAVQEDLTGHVYGGQLTVHIDARVEVPEVSRVPVYTVRFRTFSAQEKEALTRKLLGDGPYFDGNRDRAIYANCDNMVRLYEAWLKALDEGCYGPGQQENYDFHRNCNLMEYLSFEMKDMQRHSDFPATQPWTGRFDDQRFGVQNGMAQGISVTPWERGVDFSYATDGDVSFQSSPGRQPKTDREREMWAMVEDFANSLGFTEARTDLMCGVDDDIRQELFHSETGFEYDSFQFQLIPYYDGIPSYPDSYTCTGPDGVKERVTHVPYEQGPHQESITANVVQGAVTNFYWQNPLEIVSTDSENVQLLPFSQVMDIFRVQIFRSVFLGTSDEDPALWADEPPMAEEWTVHSIRFSYMRVKKADSPDYWLLPVWDFDDILTVNAVDGSIINRSAGY